MGRTFEQTEAAQSSKRCRFDAEFLLLSQSLTIVLTITTLPVVASIATARPANLSATWSPTLPAPIHSELDVESSVTMRRALWCGIVFALAVLLAVMNLMPPVSIYYRVRAQLVISQSRIESLKQLAENDRSEWISQRKSGRVAGTVGGVSADGGVVDRNPPSENSTVAQGNSLDQSESTGRPTKSAFLLSCSVLDLAEASSALAADPRDLDGQVVLVQVDSIWNRRCSAQEYVEWLSSVTSAQPNSLVVKEASEHLRLAKWELETAKHYKSQLEFKADPGQLPPSGSAKQTGKVRSFELASFKRQAEETGTQPDQFSLQLTEQIATAQAKVDHAEQLYREKMEQIAGKLELATAPYVVAKPSPVPSWLVASILIVGVATGSLAAWYQLRFQSSGAFDVRDVAEKLALDSVPIAARFQISGSPSEQSDWLENATARASDAGRRTSRQMLMFSEMGLGFWVVLIGGRFFLDAAWRDVLIDSPLAALGRLMSGMP